jgi:hypothetical protein
MPDAVDFGWNGTKWYGLVNDPGCVLELIGHLADRLIDRAAPKILDNLANFGGHAPT